MKINGKSIIMGSDSSHSPTGYGNVKNKLCPYFRDMGFNVMEMGIQNLGNPLMVDGIEKLPNHRQVPFGAQSMVEWIQERRPDVVWYLGDPHWFHWLSQMNRDLTKKDAKDYLSVVYFPIDNTILPQSFIDTLLSQDVRVTFTNYGKDICNKYGIDDIKVAHHGVDTDVFKPLPNRDQLRAQNGFADKFVVGQVNRNNFRKMTPLLMEAFSIFAEDKKDAVLFLHCDPQDSQGYDLYDYARQFKLDNKVIFNNKVKNAITGVTPQELNVYYNLFDVHASATTGEGWGLTTTEAQSAGCPVIIGNHTTGPELVRDNGWLADVLSGNNDKIYTQQGGHYHRVDLNDMVRCLEEAYADREKTRKKGAAAAKYVRGHYSWARVNRAWDEIFKEIIE